MRAFSSGWAADNSIKAKGCPAASPTESKPGLSSASRTECFEQFAAAKTDEASNNSNISGQPMTANSQEQQTTLAAAAGDRSSNSRQQQQQTTAAVKHLHKTSSFIPYPSCTTVDRFKTQAVVQMESGKASTDPVNCPETQTGNARRRFGLFRGWF
ncbi:hypothetical protein EPH_0009020 [Eimeria praecox]|uniref:Uncharacterized protein n=1 Tax=Eimeria praecox TaxID=51316 RepID=U6G313_9EIME|nr:hypothetical protein EPH_0009020 [Eimeria praecox]